MNNLDQYKLLGIKPKFHLPILPKGKTMTLTDKRETVETKTETKTDCRIKRTIAGKTVMLTPAENFRSRANYRLTRLESEFDLLSRLVGDDYERSPEQLDQIEACICTFYDAAMTSLRSTVKRSTAVKIKKYI